MNNSLVNNNSYKEILVKRWLLMLAAFVIVMVIIGGYTRLTNSGLSIVEWKPITGVIPPLNNNDWLVEFEKYKSSPEYIKINFNISFESFKFIYLVEFIHRLAGRFLGIFFIVPFLYFWRKGYLNNNQKKSFLIIFIFGIIQGFMGWYMVKSGLKNNPHVSHFRLAFHLTIAAIIYSLMLNEGFRSEKLSIGDKTSQGNKDKLLGFIVLILCFTQIFIGGLTAGSHGGLIYNQFPLMGDGLIPDEIGCTKLNDYLYNPAIIQFIHRSFAYLLVLFVVLLSMQYRVNVKFFKANVLILCVTIQFTLGVVTLLYSVPLIFGLLHQFFGFILLGIIIYCIRD